MKLKTISSDSFAPFGTVLRLDPEGENPVFQIPVKVADAPWRIALLKILPHEIDRLERHPDSRESFEPVSGFTVLFTAPEDKPEDITAFVLDCPVCLYEGIWHGVVSLTESSLCKLTENLEVGMEFHSLRSRLTVEAVCI